MPEGQNLPFYGARMFPNTLLIPALPLPSGETGAIMTEYEVKSQLNPNLGCFVVCWENRLFFDLNKNTRCCLPNKVWFTQTSTKAFKGKGFFPPLSVREETSVQTLAKTGPTPAGLHWACSALEGAPASQRMKHRSCSVHVLFLNTSQLAFQVTVVRLQALRGV